MPLALSRRAFLSGVGALALPLPTRAGEPSPRILEARPRKAQLLPAPAPQTEIQGFDRASPGPLLRYKQGDTLFARLINKTNQPLSLHWPGLRGENAMDGIAPLTQAAVPPGGEFDYKRKLEDSGLFCYRPGVFKEAGELLGHGLKGLLVVDEPTQLESDADLVVVLDDWRLDKNGAIDADFSNAGEAKDAGRLGNLLAVNGARAPKSFEHQPGSRLRLRLANLANARIMALTFEGVTPHVIAVDSQPCDPFQPVRNTIPVTPGARYELMFDLPASEGAKARVILRAADGRDQEMLLFATKGAPRAARGPIHGLPQNPALPPVIHLEHSKKVDLVIAQDNGRWTLNGQPSKAYEGDPLFRVKRGTPVTLGFDNRASVPLAMHVHGFCLRLLHDLDDGWEPYWRNTVVAPPGKVKHVAFLADSPGKWALHDDILEHEAAGVATWFEVA
jgi:FtsP/CotA-like multicopper oxidase with cupredoxin domain